VKCRYTVVAPKLATKLNFTFTVFPRFTIFTSMTAVKVPRGAKLNIGCKGGGCPFAHRTVKVPTTRLVCKRGHKHCKRKPAPAHQNISPSAINERNVKILLRSGITAPILRSGFMRVESFQRLFHSEK
jgi:hypothetical protein